MRHPAFFIALLLVLSARPAAGQCADPYYRWTEKTRESLASLAPVKQSIRTIITSWDTLEFGKQLKYKCAARKGRERNVYSVLGWVRRVKTREDDGDWHIELTARAHGTIDSCMIAEIPPAELGANYDQARADLKNRVTWDSNGDVAQPVRLRFIGAAFFDGEHRGGATRRNETDTNHGRCNSSARALWELHPVYWIKQP